MDSVAGLAVGTANGGLTTSFTQHNGIFEIAPGVKNTDWQELRLSTNSPINDWEKAVDVFRKRVGRFLEPVKALMDSSFERYADDVILTNSVGSDTLPGGFIVINQSIIVWTLKINKEYFKPTQ